MNLLDVQAIHKSFGATPVLHGVSFHAAEGEIVCLLGPSGCGKTTALRIVAGLETPDSGRVLFEGRPLDTVPVHRRGFGLMFQDFALFPHRDVAANVAFGLKMQGEPAGRVQARVTEVLEMVGLADYERRRVFELSGGEQQRVALARSLAPGPRLLMLDEPLGSLDRTLREELMNELRAVLKAVSVTALYVTHDQQEAFAVADRVLIMRQGRIVQQGPPPAVYRQPASAWVARFLGLSNLLPGRVAEVQSGQVLVDTPYGRLVARIPEGAAMRGEQVAAGRPATVLVRTEAAALVEECAEQGTVIDAVLIRCSFRGGHTRLTVRPGTAGDSAPPLVLDVVTRAEPLPEPGQPVRLVLHPEAIGLLPPEEKAGG